MSNSRKLLAYAIIILIAGVNIIPVMGNMSGVKNVTLDGTKIVEKYSMPTFDGNTLYVGGGGSGNYSRIQDAIDNASDGDTVFVYDDSSPYYENVVVHKIINLVGEDRNSTIIDGNGSYLVLKIYDNGVNISGFTIQNGEYGICIFGDGCTIVNSCIKNNDEYGISLSEYHDCVIIDNEIIGNNRGLEFFWCHDCVIIDNEITDNDVGLDIYRSSNIKILGNIISGNSRGVGLQCDTERVLIEGNIISNNVNGLGIRASSNNIISGNEFSRNWFNIVLLKGLDGSSTNNKIIDNNFIRNRFPVFQVRDSCFDNFYDGNYWNRPRLLPKWIPLSSNFDMNPAQDPYDIP